MSDIKLVAIDIDDTLLNDDKVITEDNRLEIKNAIDQGVKIVLCSGRTHRGMDDYLNKLNILGDDQYVITDGGCVVESVSGRLIYKRTLLNDVYRRIDSFVRENKLHYNAVDVDGNTYTSNNDFIDPYTILQAWENNKGLFIKTPDQLPNDFEITKAIINENKVKLDSIADLVNQKFGDDCYIIRTGDGFLELMPQHVDKGSALIALSQKLNIDISETMAIGDGENDIPMLKQAGISVAMDNATDNIKSIVNFVTSNSNESGVARALKEYVLK